MVKDVTIIAPQNKLSFNILGHFKKYYELFVFLSSRDISLRYRYFWIAFFWVAFPPLLMSIVFNFTLGKIITVTPPNIPYLIFAFLGLIFWNFFSSIVNRSSHSLLNNQALITKIYFPRILLPLASCFVSFADFICSFVVFIGLVIFYAVDISYFSFVLIVPGLFISFLFAAGLGIGFSALNIKYKDIRELLPLLLSLFFFLTPVIFPVKLISQFYYPLLYINPMMGVIDTIRTGFFGVEYINWFGLFVSFISSIVFFICGFLYFKKVEGEIIDII